MTLQTNDNGTVNDMEGSDREKADWGVEDKKSFSTKLPNDGKNYVFYGVIQKKVYGTKTVGFNPGDSRKINMVLRPKAGLADGTYTVTVELVQQGKNDVLLGTVDYTFKVTEGEITVNNK